MNIIINVKPSINGVSINKRWPIIAHGVHTMQRAHIDCLLHIDDDRQMRKTDGRTDTRIVYASASYRISFSFHYLMLAYLVLWL